MTEETREPVARPDPIQELVLEMRAGFRDIRARFDAMDRRFDGIDTRLDGMDRRFDGIDIRLDAMDRRFDGIERRLDDIVDVTHRIYNEHGARLADIEGRLSRNAHH
jgi:archaellum component FlaC